MRAEESRERDPGPSPSLRGAPGQEPPCTGSSVRERPSLSSAHTAPEGGRSAAERRMLAFGDLVLLSLRCLHRGWVGAVTAAYGVPPSLNSQSCRREAGL